MWVRFDDEKPPIGDCSKNLLLLWIKCPTNIVRYPEFYKGYELGFYDGEIFFDNNYRYRIDDVEYWSLLLDIPSNHNIKKIVKD